MRAKSAIAFLLVIAVALVPASADAAKNKKKKDNKGGKSHPSSVVIHTVDATGVVGGTVDSDEQRCVNDRLVFVDVNDENAATVHADENGDWVVDTGESFEDGDVITARVDKRNVGKAKKKGKADSCGAASDEFVVDNTPPGPPAGDDCPVPTSISEPLRGILCTIAALFPSS